MLYFGVQGLLVALCGRCSDLFVGKGHQGRLFAPFDALVFVGFGCGGGLDVVGFKGVEVGGLGALADALSGVAEDLVIDEHDDACENEEMCIQW